jgi:serine phosphatase RsbU (regulator of sigma subunit)
LIELGVYSSKADEITKVTKHKLSGISHNPKHKTIQSVDLFIGEERATSFNSDDTLSGFQSQLFKSVLDFKNAVLEDEKVAEGYQDTRDTIIYEYGKKMHYQFTYMPRKNSTIYQDSVIRIVSDRSIEENVKNEMILKFSIIFGVIVLLLIVILLFVTKSITKPIKDLVESVQKISEGNLTVRAKVVGSKEIAILADNFNHMISELEVLYNNLEEKVKERTAEIMQQKEEIEAQRDQIEEQRDSILKSKSDLEFAYRDIEDKNTRITDSVHYAKRIQTAVLPTTEQLKNMLDDYFVLYRPKDIVSGDFYWAAEKVDNVVINAADWTGHGGPGAFMSLIGNNLLNRLVLELDITDPAEILNRMRSEIITSLKQSGSSQDSKDGMDVAMCVFDKDKRTVDFSGAHNPFLLVRDNELILIKGDKMPVGYFVGEMKPFTTHTIELQKGDMIYIYSDGYQDQFGGEEGRKFMSKRFKVLLTEMAENSVELQKENLENTMDDWMINTKQLDDILVIGIKVS